MACIRTPTEFMIPCAQLILHKQAMNTSAGACSRWSGKRKSSSKIMGCERWLQSFSLAGDRTKAECPGPGNQISLICDPAPSLPPPRSQVVMEIIVIYIIHLFFKTVLLEL